MLVLVGTGGAAAEPTPLDGYDALLRAHVDDLGFVDYAALHAHPAPLHAYVASLADPGSVPPPEERDARLATLINAYNAFTLQLILDHWEQFEGSGDGAVSSITELHGGKPWDQEIWNLGGQTVSLNQIEHVMIRPQFDEPRIHWALVCAAYSCPPLRAEAYTAQRLEEQLTGQQHRVLLAGDERFIHTDGGGQTVTAVTQLFNWYAKDFGEDWKAYIRQATGQAVRSPEFIEYNWKLNSQTNRPR